MKRKLNQDDVPEEVPVVPATHRGVESFDRMGLDPRLLQAIAREKFPKPTPVQAKGIPLALEGKDIFARSKTGSGKTAVYVLPILQSILQRKAASSHTKCTSALILVPTRELAGQVTKSIIAFTAFCAQEIRAENITHKEDDKVQRARLAEKPDIVVATPGRAATHLKSSVLSLESLAHLVIDEADLVLSYGYEEDLEVIAKAIPKGVQTFLMSATLRAELDQLKGLFYRNPVALELDEEEKDSKITQYVVKCAEDEKFLLIYAIFMLKLIKGKVIVFVGDIDRCYRVKLFLEQFGIKSCVLNSELPVNSRIHVVEEFNKGVYDIIIATDEHEVMGDEDRSKKKSKEQGDGQKQTERVGIDTEAQNEHANSTTEIEPAEHPRKRRKPAVQRDKDYGVSRGIDFQHVSCVLNFDLPPSSKSYTHRIGRTARGNRFGIALSFAVPSVHFRKHPHLSHAPSARDETVLAKISNSQSRRGHTLQPYEFDMSSLSPFRYRLSSALAAVTPRTIRAARLRELKTELANSEKLKRHFEENPDELRMLRHDAETRAARVQRHLRHVPDYLLPDQKRKKVTDDLAAPFVRRDPAPVSGNRIRKARKLNRAKGRGGKGAAGAGTKKTNPLRSFRGAREKGRGD